MLLNSILKNSEIPLKYALITLTVHISSFIDFSSEMQIRHKRIKDFSYLMGLIMSMMTRMTVGIFASRLFSI